MKNLYLPVLFSIVLFFMVGLSPLKAKAAYSIEEGFSIFEEPSFSSSTDFSNYPTFFSPPPDTEYNDLPIGNDEVVPAGDAPYFLVFLLFLYGVYTLYQTRKEKTA